MGQSTWLTGGAFMVSFNNGRLVAGSRLNNKVPIFKIKILTKTKMNETSNPHLEGHKQGLPAEYEKPLTEAEQKENAENILRFAVKNSRDILKDPIKLTSFLNKIFRDMENKRFPEDWRLDGIKYPMSRVVVVKMIESVEKDTGFLKEIIKLYGKTSHTYNALVRSEAIEKINLIDDEFFKKILKEPNDPNLTSGIRTNAIMKIKDQMYLMKFVENGGTDDKNSPDYNPNYITEAPVACKVISDNNLKKLAERGHTIAQDELRLRGSKR